MALNDSQLEEFASQIQNESTWPVPTAEIGGDVGEYHDHLLVDHGSGSMAEYSARWPGSDGRLEVAEDKTMLASDTEIGEYTRGRYAVGVSRAADREAEEIGAAVIEQMLEPAASTTPFESFMLEPTRIGELDQRGYVGSHHELGSAAMYGPTEIGDANTLESQYEIGETVMQGRYGWDESVGELDQRGYVGELDQRGYVGAAMIKTIEKARDNRQPAPPMRAVNVDAEPMDDDDRGLVDTCVGAALTTGDADPFPLTSQFMQRCGAGCPPRYVRVDTEESYKQFRAENSPELSELHAHVDELSHKLDQHIADPEAHSDLAEDIDELVHIGAAADSAEAQKRVELWMPQHFDGLVEGWREGDMVCVSLALPGEDGEIRICTALEPVRKCVAEMARHAAETGVPASAIVGVLPAMGCVLGAGTVMKEVASAASSILQRPEAAGKAPFIVRIEPKANPALSALAMLAMACKAGVPQACDEWRRLGELSPAPVRQAMMEAVALAKAAA